MTGVVAEGRAPRRRWGELHLSNEAMNCPCATVGFCHLASTSSPLAIAQTGMQLIPLQTNGFTSRLH